MAKRTVKRKTVFVVEQTWNPDSMPTSWKAAAHSILGVYATRELAELAVDADERFRAKYTGVPNPLRTVISERALH